MTSVVSVQEEAPRAERVQPRLGFGAWGWLPVVSLIGACGLLLVAFADGLSRDGRAGATPLFWVGLLAIFVPAAFRLSSRTAERRERIGIVVAVGVLLYLAKVVRDPYYFTFPDELVHVHNAKEILRTHGLFSSNPILAVTPHYPGLETAAAALSSLSHLSTHVSGLIVVGGARLMIMVALFLLVERLVSSSFVAGLAALLYAATPNFLYFSAQFSYESLAIPLAIVAVFAAVRVAGTTGIERREWLITGVLVIAALTVTHHLTSYELAGFLTIVCVLYYLVRRDRLRSAPWVLAGFAIVACVAWLTLVVPSTLNSYLGPAFGHAFHSIARTISGKAPLRRPLTPQAAASPPAWEYVVSIVVVAGVAVALLSGLRNLWRSHRENPFTVVFMAAGVAYLFVLPLRFFAGTWEVANRSSESLGIGLAILLASAGLERWRPQAFRPLGRWLLAGGAGVLFVGGTIAGWPERLLLARPDRVSTQGHTLEPQGFAAAHWALRALGPHQNVAADTSNGRLLLADANENVFVAKRAKVNGIIRSPVLRAWQVGQLQRNRIPYVVVDRRRISWDGRAGYFFARAGASTSLFPVSWYEKFDRQPAVSRIFDSGNIAIYDVAGLFR